MGREGGTSRSPFDSLNLSYWIGDNPRAVDLNWQRARRLMPRAVRFAQLNQVHGSVVHTMAAGHGGEPRPEGDAMVTVVPSLALCVFTADCVPVLLADVEKRVVGAVHAGWRGIMAGVVESSLQAMVRQGAREEDIRVALGPSVGPCCYEVDQPLAQTIVERVTGAYDHMRAGDRPGKAYLDLRAIVAEQLMALRVPRQNIRNVGPCTSCKSDSYFSRRAANGAMTGLQLSFIGLLG